MDDGIIQNVHWRRTKHKISHKKQLYFAKAGYSVETKKKKEWYMTKWLGCEAPVPKKNKNKNKKKQTKAKKQIKKQNE